MKKFNKKSLVLLICAALLLTCTVSGTVAYLVDDSKELVNTFRPAYVTTDIVEGWDGTTKSAIQIRNNGNIPVYVRVAVIGNWVVTDDDGNKTVVEPWKGSFTVGSDWVKGSDGYYYYQKPLQSQGLTSDLLKSSIVSENGPDGATLVITVLHQSIQAEPTSVVADEWGVTVNGTTISK